MGDLEDVVEDSEAQPRRSLRASRGNTGTLVGVFIAVIAFVVGLGYLVVRYDREREKRQDNLATTIRGRKASGHSDDIYIVRRPAESPRSASERFGNSDGGYGRPKDKGSAFRDRKAKAQGRFGTPEGAGKWNETSSTGTQKSRCVLFIKIASWCSQYHIAYQYICCLGMPDPWPGLTLPPPAWTRIPPNQRARRLQTIRRRAEIACSS